ncbi:hypothetical protein ACIPSE_15830 [Streptomyces sp. NPDC090106]|uniref:hypothetical protein n=1 Tax=Streptomyces sp. NPDC090106 TaxID=3365946 RepID=UPI00380E56B2
MSLSKGSFHRPDRASLFNALIESAGEHRRELVELRTGVQGIEQRLRQHRARLQRLESRRRAVG